MILLCYHAVVLLSCYLFIITYAAATTQDGEDGVCKENKNPTNDVGKKTPKKTRNVHFGGTVLAPLGVSWATFRAVLGHHVAAWPPFGPRGSKREAQEQPKRVQKSLR